MTAPIYSAFTVKMALGYFDVTNIVAIEILIRAGKFYN